MDNLNFPLVFKRCPACNEGMGVITLLSMEKAGGNLPEGSKPGLVTEVPLIDAMDPPRLIGPHKVKILVYSQDICEICGAMWCNHVGVAETIVQVDSKLPGIPEMRRV